MVNFISIKQVTKKSKQKQKTNYRNHQAHFRIHTHTHPHPHIEQASSASKKKIIENKGKLSHRHDNSEHAFSGNRRGLKSS